MFIILLNKRQYSTIKLTSIIYYLTEETSELVSEESVEKSSISSENIIKEKLIKECTMTSSNILEKKSKEESFNTFANTNRYNTNLLDKIKKAYLKD